MRYISLRLVIVVLASAVVSVLLGSCTDRGVVPPPEQPEYSFDYARGYVRFWADYDVVFLPGKLSALYFDTLVTQSERHTLPQWRFFGPLKVDSVVYDGKVEQLQDSNQLAGVIISPGTLQDCLSGSCVTSLHRRIPRAIPYDTLYWSEPRGQWMVLPDLSMHFRIHFDEHRSIKRVINCLDEVRGLMYLSPLEIPSRD